MAHKPWSRRSQVLKVLACTALCMPLLGGCGSWEAVKVKAEPMPPRYYEAPAEHHVTERPLGSIWNGRGLYMDHRARDVNDLVTILVMEKTTGEKTAETDTEKTVTEDRGITSFLGIPLDFGMTDFLNFGNSFSPNLAAETASKMEGKGSTKRDGMLTASLTAKVAEVLPNGNLVLEARKEMLVNNENQILVIRGIVRPQDIRADNSVISTYVADAKIMYTGEGVLDDRQYPGWGTRMMDWVWPF